MQFKPFRPPLLRKPEESQRQERDETPDLHDHPVAKKRRLTPENEACQDMFIPPIELPEPTHDETRYFNALYRKPSAKKHKIWDGDAILRLSGGYAVLQEPSGREIGRTKFLKDLQQGSTLAIGGREIEIEAPLSRKDYLARRSPLVKIEKPKLQEIESKLRMNLQFDTLKTKETIKRPLQERVNTAKSAQPAIILEKTAIKQFKTPLLNNTVLDQTDLTKPTPRHDPNKLGALVMTRPHVVPRGKHVVDVVVDPLLSKNLRDHQREGVKFMYECIMGMRPCGGEGAVLADEMGLGKTLQVIALLWTLLKQNPVYEDGPVIKKALIVCPVTLIKNWKKEIRKWLGNERLGIFIVDDNKRKLTDFTMGRTYSIMIIGYEKLQKVQEELQRGTGIDIVIADEGHRLKTAQNKSAQAIKALSTERRIILSGTPLQNDLSEFYFMVDFVNPGLLGKASAFKRQFETPIVKSRQPEATVDDVELGESRSEELAALTSQFILRRTSEVLSKYLPPKTEFVLFCKPTSTQATVYRKVLASPLFSSVLGNSEASLQLINILKKLCNSPSLLRVKQDPVEGQNDLISTLLQSLDKSLFRTPGASGKLQVLDSLLHLLRTTTREKVVLVSHYTATLDILGNLLDSLSYPWLRLDGSTPVSKRQDLVDRFNATDSAQCFAFLLSAKSGGVGLNLTGASRLILFDIDWNPSTDLQAMARIHRDGQKRPCKIYRLVTMGALDEKIYQRQLTKLALADAVVDNKKDSTAGFTRDELRDLFSLDESGVCRTHSSLGCACRGNGEEQAPAGLGRDDGGESAEADDTTSGDERERFPALGTLQKASLADAEKQGRLLSAIQGRAEKAKTLALMQYRHVDPALLSGDVHGDEDGDGKGKGKGEERLKDREAIEAVVDDDVLVDVLKDAENRVGYVFCKVAQA